MRLWTKLSLAGIALVAATTLALWSVSVERVGPELVEYGNLCGPRAMDPCYKPVLKGGFPVAYLFDMPGVSVQGKLAFFEDRLLVGALVFDIAVYFLVIGAGGLLVSRCWAALASTMHRD